MKNHCALLLALSLLPAVGHADGPVRDWPLPAPVDAAQPNLSVAADGSLLLSWIERRGAEGHRLVFARHGAKGWSAPSVIASGKDWFVNWADFPALQALPDGSLWAHTLEKNGAATYAYNVVLRRSGDGGATWSAPKVVHDDGTPTEHGFVSLWPWSRDRVAVAWLDGRHTGGGGHDGHGAGMMSLRTAVFDAGLAKRGEWAVDASTCDCCQTDVALGARGPVLAYRDRTTDEIRDTYVSRFTGQAWSAPVRVHADGWKMPACPVNGPAIAARGDGVWVAWYTGAGDRASVRLARSGDAGASFGSMREVAAGDAQGRVDLAVDAGSVWLAWLEESAGAQSLWLARFSPDLAKELSRIRVADVAGRGRGTGFPRLALQGGVAHLAWTEVVDGKPRLRGARVAP